MTRPYFDIYDFWIFCAIILFVLSSSPNPESHISVAISHFLLGMFNTVTASYWAGVIAGKTLRENPDKGLLLHAALFGVIFLGVFL